MSFSLARYACALVSRWGVRRVPLFRYAVQRPEAQQAGVLTLYLIYYLIYYRVSTPRRYAVQRPEASAYERLFSNVSRHTLKEAHMQCSLKQARLSHTCMHPEAVGDRGLKKKIQTFIPLAHLCPEAVGG